MADATKAELAKKVYDTLCALLDEDEFDYEKEEEKLIVHFTASGEDIPMQFVLLVDVDRQMVRMYSPLPFKVCEDKRTELAIATCVASYGMTDGSFDYDITDGTIAFRMTASFMESEIGAGLLQYMIACTGAMVDRYNDQFLAISKGMMSLKDFIANDA